MHLRASQARGIPIIDDGTQQIVGFLDSPLIDPDTGRIVGFFVLPAFFGAGDVFLQSIDIVAWGTRVHVRTEDCLSPPDDIIRLKATLADPRRVIGQPIRTKDSNRTLGICSDVQFNTRHFMTEWIFPRKFFIARQPLPMTEVLEVTQDGIWIRDPLRPSKAVVTTEEESVPSLQDVVPAVQARR